MSRVDRGRNGAPSGAGGSATSRPVLTIRPKARRGLGLRDLGGYRDLLFILAGRDIKVRYRQTLLGASWVVLQPVLVSGVFAFVFGRVAGLTSEGTPYFVFAYAGLIGWNLFSNLILRVSGSLLQNTALVAKIYFPRLILPLATIVSTAVDLAVSLGVMTVLLAIEGTRIEWELLTLPLWLALVAALAAGAGLVAAGLVVRYRDVQYVTPLLLQVLLYGSPVGYATSAIPDRFRTLFALNPLVGALDGLRWSLLPNSPLRLAYVAYSVVVALVGTLTGLVVFRRAERSFADVI